MRRLTIFSLMTLIVTMALGCASGTSYTDKQPEIPALAADQGRIYIYRDGSLFGAAVQPSVRLNGKSVGLSTPGGFFYVDRHAGEYNISCQTEAKRELTMILEPQQTRYVRLKVKAGWGVGRITPVLEDKEKAMKTLKKTAYIGK